MDTIAAIATAVGVSAVSIIRLSGDSAYAIALKLFRHTNLKPVKSLRDRHMNYGVIVDQHDTVLDEVLCVYFKGPRSYTREDMIEIHTHGSQISLERIYGAVLKAGAVQAKPGEFTRRGFINGRMDLTQAEAVMDLISAQTHQGFDMAMGQLKGKVSERVNQLRVRLRKLMAHIEVCIDYPEEDIEAVTYHEIETTIKSLLNEIMEIQSASRSGKLLKDGVKVVIIGRPNVGKSSLLNALLKENRAIVTDIPGTTRDSIEEMMHLKGLPLKLVDTAGLRETEDLIEQIGVERSKAHFNEADVILLVLNNNDTLTDEDIDLFKVISHKPTVVIINKIDLEPLLNEKLIETFFPNTHIVKTSILQDTGLMDIEETLYQTVIGDSIEINKGIMTNTRQLTALEKAREALASSLEQTELMVPYEYIMVDFEETQRYFAEITGDVMDEEMMQEIFGTFCLGK